MNNKIVNYKKNKSITILKNNYWTLPKNTNYYSFHVN